MVCGAQITRNKAESAADAEGKIHVRFADGVEAGDCFELTFLILILHNRTFKNAFTKNRAEGTVALAKRGR